ncbi:Putative 2EXR domain-containing protein [Colletotrichum destructivum]|uniref:2EXR domain-containing protein n=1 Tax=Colletotrichum destructivum TaxID=34406 RepID=A0AAX4IN02_9PEZI|nr:Putative 2EXR domain-containing protein [Colletotrichum destructivum]
MCGNNDAAEFYSFSKLPVELRLNVWRLSLPATRVVSIRCVTMPLSEASDSSWGTSPARIPANLHVCRESRQEASKYYKLRFEVAGPPKVYFDPEVDILHFGPASGFMASSAQYFTVMCLCGPSDLKDIRHLAIDESVLSNGIVKGAEAHLTARTIRQLPLRMPNLKRLDFVRNEAASVPQNLPVLAETEDYHRNFQKLVESTMRRIAGESPNWEVPPWRIATLQLEPGSKLLLGST